MKVFLVASSITLVLLWTNGAQGLAGSEKDAMESPCFEIKEPVTVDAKWYESVKRQYYPVMSLLDLWRGTQDLLQKGWKEIKPSTIFYDACIEMSIEDNGSFLYSGFNGKKNDLNMKVLSPGYEKFEFAFPNSGITGKCSTFLTDNSTFVAAACCHSDNQMTWAAFSTVPSLPQETLEEIRSAAVSLGFKKEYFSELRYDTCPKVAARNCNEVKVEAEKIKQ